MNFYQSLQSNPAVPTRLDHRVISYPIVGKEAPANPGRSGRSMQDIAEPVIPGSSKHRETLVWSAFGNASSSLASTSSERRRGGGSGGDGEGDSWDDIHEREREWESEWERESARRADE